MGEDKIKHFLAGLVISYGCGLVGYPRFGLGAGITAGIGKELWDRKHPPHIAEINDALATILGAVVGFLLTH